MPDRVHTITSASAALASGTLSACDLVEHSLQAIARDGPRTNAFVTVDEAGAREAARRADRELERGAHVGPLFGIPISIKDLIDVEGVVTTAGSRALGDRRAAKTAPLIARLTEAGAIIIGRTNLQEFALGTMSDSSAFGPVRHPLDPERSAGGSSGGSAAAVATGMGLASIGTDTGGSVRIPAAACGVVGLKPAYGEISTEGVVPLSSSLDHVGPLAWSVQDAALLYAVMAGGPPRTLDAAPLGDLRLARLTGAFDFVEPDVQSAVDAAIAVLARSGAQISSVTLPHANRISERYSHLVLSEAAHWHAPLLETRAGDYTAPVRERLQHGRTILAVDYIEARAFRDRLRRTVDALFEDADALILPTLPLVAPRLGTETVTLGAGPAVPVRAAMLRHTQPFNMSGHPALTLPVPAPGLPVGLQLVGPSTPRLLEIALACERHLSS
jgi:aspartyl-tRNA(Asn)/glutamyl-tRNA(Gln) amidotransferase subunit A